MTTAERSVDVPSARPTRHARYKNRCAERPLWHGFLTFEMRFGAASRLVQPYVYSRRPRPHALDALRPLTAASSRATSDYHGYGPELPSLRYHSDEGAKILRLVQVALTWDEA